MGGPTSTRQTPQDQPLDCCRSSRRSWTPRQAPDTPPLLQTSPPWELRASGSLSRKERGWRRPLRRPTGGPALPQRWCCIQGPGRPHVQSWPPVLRGQGDAGVSPEKAGAVPPPVPPTSDMLGGPSPGVALGRDTFSDAPRCWGAFGISEACWPGDFVGRTTVGVYSCGCSSHDETGVVGFGEHQHRGDAALWSPHIPRTCSPPDWSPWTPTLTTRPRHLCRVSPLSGCDFPSHVLPGPTAPDPPLDMQSFGVDEVVPKAFRTRRLTGATS